MNRIRVAAYQSPLAVQDPHDAIELIQQRVRQCEEDGVSVLCCPEAVLGGLADFSESPRLHALRIDNGQLASTLMPLASETVTSIVGFTELGSAGAIYNAAAVFKQGCVTGVYRKIHPAIRRSCYSAGDGTPVFRAGDLTFGVVICNDSNYPDLAVRFRAQGATALFIPTNNSLPKERASQALNAAARSVDRALARHHEMWIVRSDVAGENGTLACYGCSEIVSPQGDVVQEARLHEPDLLIAAIEL